MVAFPFVWPAAPVVNGGRRGNVAISALPAHRALGIVRTDP